MDHRTRNGKFHGKRSSFEVIRNCKSISLFFRRRLKIFHIQRGRNVDTVFYGPRHRAEFGVKAMNPLGGFAIFRGQFQLVLHMNTPDNDGLVQFFNFTPCLGNQAFFTGRYFARFQRAAKGAG